MSQAWYFGTEIQATVQAVENELRDYLITVVPHFQRINYLCAGPYEVNQRMQEYASATGSERDNAYPFIALLEPWEIVYPGTTDYFRVRSVRILIGMPTDITWTSYQRQQRNFNPVLYPIYNKFIEQLSKRSSFVIQNPRRDIPHVRKEYKGSGAFNSLTDLIEIRELELKLSLKNC